MNTTTPYQIAKKLNKPAQVIYKKIEILLKKPPCENIDEHIKKVDDKWIVDNIGEDLIIKSFKDEQSSEQQNEQFEQLLYTQMNNEILTLKEQLKLSQEQNKSLQELLNAEREDTKNRVLEQNERILSLAEQLASLNHNNQILLGAEASRTNPALLMNTTDKNETEGTPDERPQKTNIFSKIFKREKKNQ